MPVILIPDEVLLRRFGYVRAVGGSAYIVAVAVLFGMFGTQVWPLLLGVPVLALATVAYFVRSNRTPRASVAVSLLADALVLGGAIAFLGGSGSGLVMLYGIVVVSAGILLGPVPAYSYTALCFLLGGAQLVLEELGVTPALLHRPDLGSRVPILLVSLAGLASIGYLTATYASRLHELIAEAGVAAEVVRRRGRRQSSFAQHAARDVKDALRGLEDVADLLDAGGDLPALERTRLASRLRVEVTRLDAEVSQLADLGALDPTGEAALEPVDLRRVVDDCLVGLGDRLDGYDIEVDAEGVKVVANRRHARRVVLSLVENVVEHTPAGTAIRIRTLVTAGRGVLVVTDDGPGVPPERVAQLFDPPEGDDPVAVGLPLAAELCAAMGGECRYEPAPGGGSRFIVSLRLAPSAAPTRDDEREGPGAPP